MQGHHVPAGGGLDTCGPITARCAGWAWGDSEGVTYPLQPS
jgi:hypothetical protein